MLFILRLNSEFEAAEVVDLAYSKSLFSFNLLLLLFLKIQIMSIIKVHFLPQNYLFKEKFKIKIVHF